jgi:hypothetical protein
MNIFTILTMVIVVGLAGYTIFLVYKHQQKLSAIKGIIIANAVSIMSGLMCGFLVSIISGDLFLGGGIGLIVGGIVGFLTGQPTGFLAMLSGLPSGIMGGIIGALLGIFLSIENPLIMLSILLVCDMIVMGFTILFIKVETSDGFRFDTKAISPFAIISVGVILVSLFLFLYSSNLIKFDTNSDQTQTSTSTQTTTNTGTNASASANSSSANGVTKDVTSEKNPTIKMEVTPTGYTPNVIYVKKGVPFKLEIHNTLENSCLSTILIPVFHIDDNLKIGTTIVTITPTKTGEFGFTCGMNMYGGKIIVE